jgi:hypothetical protein
MGDISIHNYPDFAGPRPRKKGQQPPKITTNPSKERHAKGAIDLERNIGKWLVGRLNCWKAGMRGVFDGCH